MTIEPIVTQLTKVKKVRKVRKDRSGRIIPKDPRNDKAMNEFWTHIDKEEMFEALTKDIDNDENKDAVALAHYLIRPDFRGSLSMACRKCGISLNKLNDLWRNHQLAQGLIQVASRLPKVMEDTAVDAESRFEVCERCDGLGTILRSTIVDDKMVNTEETCPKCKGAKECRVSGDAKARDQVFEMVGLTGKGSGPLVAIQQNIVGENFEDTLNIAQKLLTRKSGA